jgi:WXG100 family type VII secretion target
VARIKITPDQVMGVAGDFKNASAQSSEMVTRLTGVINNLAPEWEGMSSQRFYQDFQQWQAAMKQFVDLLGGISLQLEQIAHRFREADQRG